MAKGFFTPEQITALESRRARLLANEPKWRAVAKRLALAQAAGLDPKCAEVQGLATEFQSYIDDLSGGDAAMESSLAAFWRADPAGGAASLGVDPAVIQYFAEARKAARLGLVDDEEPTVRTQPAFVRWKN